MAWKAPEPKLESYPDGLVVFDHTNIQKKYTFDAALAHDDSNISSPPHAQEIINCIYVDPISHLCRVIDHRVLDRHRDGKTMLDHVRDMLNKAMRNKATPFSTVVMKQWYATEAIMLFIDGSSKAYWCPVRNNRLADDSEGTDKYKSVKNIVFGAAALRHGKVVKLKSYPSDHPVKLFRIIGANRMVDHVATNQIKENAVEKALLMGGFRETKKTRLSMKRRSAPH